MNLFVKDIFGEERPASPEHIEDDIPTQAFVRRKEAERTDVNPKPVLKTNNLSRALQSRLDRRKSSVDEKPKGFLIILHLYLIFYLSVYLFLVNIKMAEPNRPNFLKNIAILECIKIN